MIHDRLLVGGVLTVARSDGYSSLIWQIQRLWDVHIPPKLTYALLAPAALASVNHH